MSISLNWKECCFACIQLSLISLFSSSLNFCPRIPDVNRYSVDISRKNKSHMRPPFIGWRSVTGNPRPSDYADVNMYCDHISRNPTPSIQSISKACFFFCACKIYFIKQMKKLNYTVIKHDGHLRARSKEM